MGLTTREEISHPENDVYVSAATTWEMSIKRQLGKLEAPNDIELKVEQAGFLKLSISLFHGEQAGLLPLHRRDPFDRVIIAQAQAEGLVIVTKDSGLNNMRNLTQNFCSRLNDLKRRIVTLRND